MWHDVTQARANSDRIPPIKNGMKYTYKPDAFVPVILIWVSTQRGASSFAGKNIQVCQSWCPSRIYHPRLDGNSKFHLATDIRLGSSVREGTPWRWGNPKVHEPGLIYNLWSSVALNNIVNLSEEAAAAVAAAAPATTATASTTMDYTPSTPTPTTPTTTTPTTPTPTTPTPTPTIVCNSLWM